MGLFRLLLAISVILAHSTGTTPFVRGLVGGPAAVQCFFMLSGFYMTLVLHEKYDSALPFYWNRFSRIYSAYFVALAFAVAVGLVVGPNIYWEIANSGFDFATKGLLFTANTGLIGTDWIMFLNPGESGLTFTPDFRVTDPKLYQYLYMSPAWSLPVELMFYLVAPLIVRSPRLLVGAALVSLASRTATYATFGAHDPWTYRFFPNELVFFVAGAGSYYMLKHIRHLSFAMTLGLPLVAALILFVLSYERLRQASSRFRLSP